MAHATHLTISTSDRIRLDSSTVDGLDDGENEVRQEVQVSVTYALDPGDTNLVVLAERKALEVKLAHEAVWDRIGAFSSGGSNLGCCSGRPKTSENQVDDEDTDDGGGGREDDPLAGLPQRGDDPFGGGPIPAGAARPFPAVPTNRETQESGGSSRKGRHLPDVKPDPVPGSEPDADPLTGPQKILIRSRARKIGLSAHSLETLVFQQFKVWKVERLSKEQAATLLAALERDLKEKEGKDEKQAKDRKEDIPHADRNGRAAIA